MPRGLVRPWLVESAARLNELVTDRDTRRVELARALNVSPTTINNMLQGRVPVTRTRANRLGPLLQVDPATIVSPRAPSASKPRGRPAGPASRALVLHAQANGPPPPPVPPPPRPVMQLELLDNDRGRIRVDMTMSTARAKGLFRLLLDYDGDWHCTPAME